MKEGEREREMEELVHLEKYVQYGNVTVRYRQVRKQW